MTTKAHKQLIRINDDNECMYIIHAFPGVFGRKFKWFASSNKDFSGIEVPNQVYESITLKSEDIRKLQWDNMYIHCEYRDEMGVLHKSEYIKLHSHFIVAVHYGKFDKVNVFTNTGMEEYSEAV